MARRGNASKHLHDIPLQILKFHEFLKEELQTLSIYLESLSIFTFHFNCPIGEHSRYLEWDRPIWFEFNWENTQTRIIEQDDITHLKFTLKDFGIMPTSLFSPYTVLNFHTLSTEIPPTNEVDLLPKVTC